MQHHWALKHYPWTPLLKSKAEGMAILTPHTLSTTGSDVARRRRVRTGRTSAGSWCGASSPGPTTRRTACTTCTSSAATPTSDRLDQAQRVAALVAEHGGAPAVVAGDFNDPDEPAVIEALPGIEGPATANTNPADTPRQRIDHVLVPDNATDITVKVPGGRRRVGRPVGSLTGDDDVRARLGRGRLPRHRDLPSDAQAFLAALAGFSTPLAKASSR